MMLDKIGIKFKEFKNFLYEAKTNCYGERVKERKGKNFNCMSFKKDKLLYLVVYSKLSYIPTREIVIVKPENLKIWHSGFSWEREKSFSSGIFLKDILSYKMSKSFPLRGSGKLDKENKIYSSRIIDGPRTYSSKIKGDISDFFGNERICEKGSLTLSGDFHGGFLG